VEVDARDVEAPRAKRPETNHPFRVQNASGLNLAPAAGKVEGEGEVSDDDACRGPSASLAPAAQIRYCTAVQYLVTAQSRPKRSEKIK
jgi:hypothetical protein